MKVRAAIVGAKPTRRWDNETKQYAETIGTTYTIVGFKPAATLINIKVKNSAAAITQADITTAYKNGKAIWGEFTNYSDFPYQKEGAKRGEFVYYGSADEVTLVEGGDPFDFN